MALESRLGSLQDMLALYSRRERSLLSERQAEDGKYDSDLSLRLQEIETDFSQKIQPYALDRMQLVADLASSKLKLEDLQRGIRDLEETIELSLQIEVELERSRETQKEQEHQQFNSAKEQRQARRNQQDLDLSQNFVETLRCTFEHVTPIPARKRRRCDEIISIAAEALGIDESEEPEGDLALLNLSYGEA